MSVVVMVSARVKEGQQEAFEAAFEAVRERVSGTPGHRGDRLLRICGEENRYILAGEWESVARFLEWEESPVHRQTTTPMRPFWDGPVERTILVTADLAQAHAVYGAPAPAAR